MAVNETVGINLVADTKSLRSQLREATQELQKLQNSATASAEEIRKAAKRAGELKDRIGDAKATVDAFNPDAKFKAIGQTIVGVAGAFTAVQGALALVGVESDQVQKTLLKVQGALALSQGLNSVLELKDAFNNLKIQVAGSTVVQAANTAVTAIASTVMKVFGIEVVATSGTFKVLKTAIAATGIGLLIVLLGAAVIAFNDFQLSAEKSAEAQQKFNDQVNESNEKQRKVESDFIKDNTRARLADAKARGASAKEIFNIEDGARRNEINSQIRLIDEKKKLKLPIAEAELELNKLERDRKISQQEFLANIADAGRKKQDADTKKSEEERIEKEILLEEKRIERLLEVGKKGTSEYKRKLAELTLQYESDIELFSKNENTKILITKKFEEEKFKLFKENRKKLTEEEEKEIELKLKKLEIQGKKEADQANKNVSLITAAMDNSIKMAKNNLEQTKDIEDAKIFFKEFKASREIEIAQQLGFALQQIAGKNKELAVLGIVIEQSAALGSIAINAKKNFIKDGGVTSPLAYFGLIGSIASALAVVTAGAQAIRNINSAGMGSSGSGNNIGGVSAGASAPVAPPTPRPQATSLDSASLNQINNVVGRAYVVESDITGSQKRIRRIENAARI